MPVAAPAPTTPAAPAPTPAPAAGGFSFGFSGDQPAAPIAAPAEVEAEETLAPLSFDKAADETADANATQEAAPLSFDKADDVAAPVVAAVIAPDATVSLDKTDESLAGDDDFDLDDVFGAPAAPNADIEDAGFDANVADDDFDVSELEMTDAESDDFSSFGAGLSQSGETDDATLYAAMQPVLDDLATEVRRSLEFHLGRYPDTTFSRLVLVGGGAKLRNLDEFLTGNLGVPTSVGNPFAHIKVDTPGLPPRIRADQRAAMRGRAGFGVARFHRVNEIELSSQVKSRKLELEAREIGAFVPLEF